MPLRFLQDGGLPQQELYDHHPDIGSVEIDVGSVGQVDNDRRRGAG
jgi:hypothetical protein